MALTKAQLVSRVQTITERDDLDTYILQFLNDGLKKIARDHTWRDLMIEKTTTLTADAYRYSFPSDMKECLGLRIIDDAESVWLTEISQVRLDAYEPLPSSRGSGRPSYYAVDGDYFEIFPPPDSAYSLRIRYNRWPDELVQDSDVPDIDQVDDVLSSMAAAEIFALVGDFDSSRQWEARAAGRMKDARIQDMRRPVWRPVPGSAPRRGVLPADYWNRPDVMGVG